MSAHQSTEFPVETMRHSAAHLLAAALTRLYPGIKLGVGPVVEHGFYYDVDLPEPISKKDFPRIEKMMGKIRAEKLGFVREEMSLADAKALMAEQGQTYKVKLLEDLAQYGTTKLSEQEAAVTTGAGESPIITLYRTGDFVDLCRGPHVDTTNQIGAYKLHAVAGAYWRGDETQPMLQRIYGFAFATQDELDAHLHMLEEAEKRDHRKLGKELGLFTFSELVGPGLPLWTPRGTLIRDLLNDYVWELRKAHDYQKVTIPHITKKDLYETSGHWAKYADDLFKIETREGHLYAMKPMNCPFHTQIFDAEPRSYRDMPVRYAETTMVYRDEQSGELSGLSRVLSITQDDAHVFCRMSQFREEAEKVWEIIETFYGAFGFQLTKRLSRRDLKHPEKYLGASEDWDKAEDALRTMLDEHQVEWIDGPGEAAFYGPKIDFMAQDSIGRTWQVATIQLDFNQPKSFGLTCTNEKGEKEPIVMIHCAIMGSIERFMSVIIEHFAGAFPAWLAPVQVALLPVGLDHQEACQTFAATLRAEGIRVTVDASNESVGKKIRAAEKAKVPYMLVIGDKEKDLETFSVRVRGQQDNVEIAREALIAQITKEIREKRA